VNYEKWYLYDFATCAAKTNVKNQNTHYNPTLTLRRFKHLLKLNRVLVFE